MFYCFYSWLKMFFCLKLERQPKCFEDFNDWSRGYLSGQLGKWTRHYIQLFSKTIYPKFTKVLATRSMWAIQSMLTWEFLIVSIAIIHLNILGKLILKVACTTLNFLFNYCTEKSFKNFFFNSEKNFGFAENHRRNP